MPSAPAIEPALIDAKAAAKFLAIGVRKLWEMSICGDIPSVLIGKARRYSVDSLRRWITENENTQ